MNEDQTLKKIKHKLIVEAVLKSLIVAADIAFAAAAVIALGFWFSPYNGTWYAVGALLGLLAVLTPVFYFFKYRPTEETLARRLDRLGLEDRMITMTELKGDESYIARRQAEDAKTKFASAAVGKAFAVAIPAVMAIPLALTAIAGGGMITVNALSQQGVIRSGNQIIEDMVDPEDELYYSVVYKVYGIDYNALAEGTAQEGVDYGEDVGGFIEGNTEQIVVRGGAATPVIAVADEDWVFGGWDVEAAATTGAEVNADPYREDLEVIATGDNSYYDRTTGETIIVHTAYFVKLGPGDDYPGEGGDGEPQEGESEADAPPEDPDKSDPSDSESGELDNSKDKVVDGEKDYRDLYQDYYDAAMEMLANGENIPEEYKKIIKDYYDIIV